MADDQERTPQERLMLISAAAGLIVLLILLFSGMNVVASFLVGILLAVAIYLILQHGVGDRMPALPGSRNDAGKTARETGVGDTARDMAATAGEKAGDAAATAGETLADGAANLKEKAADVASGAAEKASDAAQTVTGGSDATETAPGGGAAKSGAAPVSVNPTAPLAGEAELADRKASWKYNDDTEEEPADIPDVAPGQGEKPEMLASAREGGADDLKAIKGVGPKLEELLHSMGVYHFDQIAGWGDAEVAWMDNNLQGFKGRVSRDDWVEQAKILAGGGKTEFSKKVDKGGVY